MAVDIATFRVRYPEFDDPVQSDAQIQVLLDDAECDFSRSKLSDNTCGDNIYDRIIFSLAAHNAQLSVNRGKGNTAAGGVISSKSVGKVSVSYSRATSNSQSDDFFNQTIFGQTYLQLLNKYCPTMLTI